MRGATVLPSAIRDEAPIGETAQLRARRFHADDWRDLHAYLSMPEVYRFEPGGPIDCANSGTTLRLLAGLLAGKAGRFELTGAEWLLRGPVDVVYFDNADFNGAPVTSERFPNTRMMWND